MANYTYCVYAPNLISICIDRKNGTDYEGRIWNEYDPEPRRFSGMLQAIEQIEEFLDDTNIVEIVKANVDKKLIVELEKAVDENIEYRTGIHKNTLEDALTSLLHTVEQKINDVDTEGMMEMAMKLNSISDELTPERMLQAYSETDMFKNRIYEKEKERKHTEAVIKESAKK